VVHIVRPCAYGFHSPPCNVRVELNPRRQMTNMHVGQSLSGVKDKLVQSSGRAQLMHVGQSQTTITTVSCATAYAQCFVVPRRRQQYSEPRAPSPCNRGVFNRAVLLSKKPQCDF